MSHSQAADREEGSKNINGHKNIRASRPRFPREMTARLERRIKSKNGTPQTMVTNQ